MRTKFSALCCAVSTDKLCLREATKLPYIMESADITAESAFFALSITHFANSSG